MVDKVPPKKDKPVVDDGSGMDAPNANAKGKGGGDSGAAGGTLYEQAMAAVNSIDQDSPEIGLQKMWELLKTSPNRTGSALPEKKSEETNNLDDTSTKEGPSPKK